MGLRKPRSIPSQSKTAPCKKESNRDPTSGSYPDTRNRMAAVVLHRLSICLYLHALFSREFCRVLYAFVVSSHDCQSSGMGRIDTVGSRSHFARPSPAIGVRWRRTRSMDTIRGLCSICRGRHIVLECRRKRAEELRHAPRVAPGHPTVCPGDRDGHLRRIQDLSSPDASAAPC